MRTLLVGLWRLIVLSLRLFATASHPAVVSRGNASILTLESETIDAVVTDPPYYDNVSYADLSDFFYVWLKRSIGHYFPEHFATEGTPKKNKAVADASRHNGKKDKARVAYETMMASAFVEAHRVLKPEGQLVVVYAHKTTLGWSTLVDALRTLEFHGDRSMAFGHRKTRTT